MKHFSCIFSRYIGHWFGYVQALMTLCCNNSFLFTYIKFPLYRWHMKRPSRTLWNYHPETQREIVLWLEVCFFGPFSKVCKIVFKMFIMFNKNTSQVDWLWQQEAFWGTLARWWTKVGCPGTCSTCVSIGRMLTWTWLTSTITPG